MRGALWLALPLLLASCTRLPAPGEPLNGLTRVQRDRFVRGKVVFERTFTPESGLGPLFNADACGECHEAPVVGGVGDEVELHATAVLQDGFCDPLAELGGPVYQQEVTPALRAAIGIDSEPVPSHAAQGRRTTPDVLGFGLLDAVPDAAILANADPEDRDRDGVSGRPNRFFDGRLGRFGRKAFVPSLAEFNEGAFQVEQGVTTPAVADEGTVGGKPIPAGVDPLPEPELSAADVVLTDAFVRFLAPPARPRLDREAKRGRALFAQAGCTGCHLPQLQTGPGEVAALSGQRVEAYTDLLLHDMGPELADICLGLASPSEFRTEPLMGLRFSTTFLHDGRATSIEEAIRLHGGEGTASRARFEALKPEDRAAVLAFLRML